MNTKITYFFILFLAMLSHAFAVTPPGDLRLTPTSLKLKVYKFAVSTSPLCTNLITVIDNGDTPQEVEFIGSVKLGAGNLAAGTYPCVVVEMSDNIKYTPGSTSTSGFCQSGVPNTLDVCRDQGAPTTSPLIDGSVTTCSAGVVDDRVAMYMSTYSPGTGDVFNPPTADGVGDGFNLPNPLVVSGSTTAQFIVNPEAKMCDNSNDAGNDCDGGGATNTCQLEPPTFDFSF